MSIECQDKMHEYTKEFTPSYTLCAIDPQRSRQLNGFSSRPSRMIERFALR